MKRILITTTAAIGVAVLALSAVGGAMAQPEMGMGMGMGMRGDHHMMRNMSPEDIAAHRAAMFKAMDANGDGTLTQEEFVNRENTPAWTAFRESRRSERHNERFAAMDTNKDGTISPDEFRAYHEQRRGKGPGAQPK